MNVSLWIRFHRNNETEREIRPETEIYYPSPCSLVKTMAVVLPLFIFLGGMSIFRSSECVAWDLRIVGLKEAIEECRHQTEMRQEKYRHQSDINCNLSYSFFGSNISAEIEAFCEGNKRLFRPDAIPEIWRTARDVDTCQKYWYEPLNRTQEQGLTCFVEWITLGLADEAGAKRKLAKELEEKPISC